MSETKDIVVRLRENCNGHPHAKIAWPHRILHEAAETIESDRALLERARDEITLSLSHIRDLEEAWRSGAITESDGRGGERSNRNVRIRNGLEQILTAINAHLLGSKMKDNWRPIESAPKDGTPIILWSPSTHTYSHCGRYWEQDLLWM